MGSAKQAAQGGTVWPPSFLKGLALRVVLCYWMGKTGERERDGARLYNFADRVQDM